MKLSECKIGILVCFCADRAENTKLEIGHIVGLSINGDGKVIPMVAFAGKEPYPVHYANIEPFTAW